MTVDSIKFAQPRETVQVRLPDGRILSGPVGTQLYDFVQVAFPEAPCPIVGAIVDGKISELSRLVDRDVQIMPFDTSTSDGMRIYQRSMCFLLIVAVRELYPEARVVIDHSVALGGFYCQIEGRELFSNEELTAIEQRMRDIVATDEPIVKARMPVPEAKEMFARQGYTDKVRLLEYRTKPDVAVYCLRGVYDYFYGAMVARVGQLQWFSLRRYDQGVILRLPGRRHPTKLFKLLAYPKLTRVFAKYRDWLNILGLEDIGSLNAAVKGGDIRRAILVSEALHEKHISDIADEVVQRQPAVRLVLIAGPSSSGKTTFSRRLAIQLMVNGLRPYALGLDDYFVDRDRTPKDAHGNFDFEALEAIDLELFNQQLVALMAGERVRLPRYDFQTGKSGWGAEAQLPPDGVLIVEGIHGLNPKLITSVSDKRVFRIYASALTQLNIDHHNRVPTTDSRLIRRIVRDSRYRGYPASETIARWESVRRGEERNIFPYQENADVMFNSALVYELAVLKPLVEPLLLRVPAGSLESLEARRLLAFLRWVEPCGTDWVPGNSLLREFVGDSILRDFSF